MAYRGFMGAVLKRSADPEGKWFGGFGVASATGLHIDQQTAMAATAVMACVSVLSEDVSKMTPDIFRRVTVVNHDRGGRKVAKDHFLYNLLWSPNPVQTWPEFCRFMMVAYLLRGNAYAVMIRNGRGIPIMWLPINPDHVALWESPDGSLFWRVTRIGLWQTAMLRDLPLLIPYEDVFHLKDLSANGLVGTSRITLAREAIGLSIGQERSTRASWATARARADI
jgi:HK97 family phage portal protein